MTILFPTLPAFLELLDLKLFVPYGDVLMRIDAERDVGDHPEEAVAAPQRVEVGISLFELLDFPIRFHQAHADYVVADLAGFIGKGRILGRPQAAAPIVSGPSSVLTRSWAFLLCPRATLMKVRPVGT